MCVCVCVCVCVYRMLAYRAEDISQRLEPQELYDRQEFEESIQFDVSDKKNSNNPSLHDILCPPIHLWLSCYRLLRSAF